MKRLLSALLCAAFLLSGARVSACGSFLTRLECAAMISLAADDYTGAGISEILRGSESSSDAVSRGEALIMLARAFSPLPSIEGATIRSTSPPPGTPARLAAEAEDIFASGISAWPTDAPLCADAPVTADELSLMLHRIYAVFASNPRDDFYAAVCRRSPGESTFADAQEAVLADLLDIAERHVSSPVSAGDDTLSQLYSALLDLAGREALGLVPVRKYLDAIDSAEDISDLLDVRAAYFRQTGTELLFGFDIDIDPHSGGYIPVLSVSLGETGGLSLESRASAFREYVSALLTLSGEAPDAAALYTDSILTAECDAAERSTASGSSSGADEMPEILSARKLDALLPGASAALELSVPGFGRAAVSDAGRVRALGDFFRSAPIGTLRAYCKAELLSSACLMLTPELRDISLRFYDALRGEQSDRSESELALSAACRYMPEHLSELYASECLSLSAAVSAEALAREIKEVFGEHIRSLSWMSRETKEKALEKLASIRFFIGSEPEVQAPGYVCKAGDSLFDICAGLGRERRRCRLELLQHSGTPAMHMPQYCVNACYVPFENAVYLPAAIIREPFFSENASYEQNLGLLGYIIAHEVTHAFDDRGSKYDKNGRLCDWWSDADRAAFSFLCSQAEQLYDGREAAPGISCSGSLTLSENIADLGAVSCIVDLCRRHGGSEALLFISSARLWKSSASDASLRRLAESDVHAPAKLRGGFVFSQFDEFYDAFGIDESDGMWLEPEKRVTIW